MSEFLDPVRDAVRGVMREIAILVDRLSFGRITPGQVTIASLLLHLPIALAIYNDQLPQAAVMLVAFGLLDTLDGELARVQKSTSSWGALLDAVSDRAKEILVYGGLVYWLAVYESSTAAAVAVVALGGSLLVSYIKAKGEADLRASQPKIKRATINRLLSTGLMQFEVRIGFIVLALLVDQIFIVVVLIGVLSWYTAFERMMAVRLYLFKRPDSNL